MRPQLLQPDEKRKRLGLSFLVLDEADLILSMPGYAEDLRALVPHVRYATPASSHGPRIVNAKDQEAEVPVQIPRGCQCMLMSATTNEAVEELQKLMLHDPVTLDLAQQQQSTDQDLAVSEPDRSAAGIATEIEHFGIRCSRSRLCFEQKACQIAPQSFISPNRCGGLDLILQAR